MKKFKLGFKLGLMATVLLLLFFGVQTNTYALPLPSLALQLDDGLGHVVTLVDDDLDGIVSFNGALGNWTINFTTGISYPAIGSPSQPFLDLVSFNATSGSGGTLDIQVSANGFTHLGEGVLSVGGTTQGNFTASAYYDSNNNLFAQTTQIGSTLAYSPISFSGDTNGTVVDTSGLSPYSLTIDLDIFHPSSGATSFDAQLAVPEPGSLIFFGTGLLGLGFAIRCRKK